MLLNNKQWWENKENKKKYTYEKEDGIHVGLQVP